MMLLQESQLLSLLKVNYDETPLPEMFGVCRSPQSLTKVAPPFENIPEAML